MGEGCQKRTREPCRDTAGLICLLTAEGHIRGTGPLHGVVHLPTNLVNAAVLSVGKYLICLVATGRGRVQLWVENIFDRNCPSETPLREWAHRQYQDLQTELWAKAAGPLGGQWTSRHYVCKQVFPSSGMYICCLRGSSFVRLF